MILEMDLGNTRCKWRLRSGKDIVARDAFAISGSFDQINQSLVNFPRHVSQVWVASVVGADLENALSEWCRTTFLLTPRFAQSTKQFLNVINGYESPGLLGVDRWLSVIACNQRFQKGCVVVSMGTAITVDLISKEGIHSGGFIAPGLNLMLDSLQKRTSKVHFEPGGFVPDLAPGNSTAAAIHSALTAMLSGLIDNGLKQMNLRHPNESAELIFAGGNAQVFLPIYPHARLIKDLVLDGLAYIFDESKRVG